ncbi:AbrB/MazE/SpoVT family DNA-binding domain-containing protein [Microbacterium protaetiae]|uniref:AbrB/MazE/SpoVT family DNA-binding domain-containing protein n=1 Tax=Microbacterium protaetiae TaxID=2509458 RepID=A0A4P6EHA5_9MICO|nr:AbrB/MazE/SpoVT family DNA-binding domain-containing protein [Microbacterium protaetiae]
MDRAGRIVIPKELRDAIGLTVGPVDVHVVGNAIQIEIPDADAPLEQDEDGLWTIGTSGTAITDDDVRELRHGLQQR